ALKRPDRRLVQRRNAAGLLDANIGRRSVTQNVEREVNPLSQCAGIDLNRVPVVRNLSVYCLHVPGKAAADIASTLEIKTALGMRGGESPVRAANRPTFAVRNYIILRWRWLQRFDVG